MGKSLMTKRIFFFLLIIFFACNCTRQKLVDHPRDCCIYSVENILIASANSGIMELTIKKDGIDQWKYLNLFVISTNNDTLAKLDCGCISILDNSMTTINLGTSLSELPPLITFRVELTDGHRDCCKELSMITD